MKGVGGFRVCLLLVLAAFAVQARPQQTPRPELIEQAEKAFRAGYAAQQAGQFEVARTQFATAVRLQPHIPEGHEALGAVLLELGKPAEAIAELQAAAKLKPGDAGIETNLAFACSQAGQAAKALPHFEAALRTAKESLSPAFYDAYGRALAANGKPAEALQQFKTEEKLAGPHAEIDDAIGAMNARLAQWDDAQQALERAVAEDGNYTQARVHLGVVYRERHDLPASIAALEPAARADPPDMNASLEYGRSLAAAGQDDAAVPAFERALQRDPKQAVGASDLAMALQRLGRQQEAVPWFEKALASDPQNPDILTNLGLALTLTGKAKEALDYFARARALMPKSPTLYKDYGVAHIQLSAFDDAIGDFKTALALDGNDPQLHYDLGLAYKFKDRLDDAVAELSKAGEMEPNLEDPPYTLGILYMQMGKLDEAITELKRAAALRPDNGNGWAILGSTLKQDGRLDEAREALEKAIPLQPGQPGPRVTLAGVLAEQAGNLASQADAAEAAGDQAKADQLRGEAKELRGKAAEYRKEGAELSRAAVNRQRANFALNAGNQLLLRGQIADAIARYQESIAADAAFADPHTQLALAYDRQGRTQDAAAERTRATELESKP